MDRQTNKIDQMLKEIQDYEITNSNLIRKTELTTKELIKRKMLILDLKNCMNKKKLHKLETSKEEVDEAILNKEIELNLFLNAQHDYYKRKLELAKLNLDSLENDYDKLKTEYNFLIDTLPINYHEEDQNLYTSYSKLNDRIAQDCSESCRQYETNKAQFNYLESSMISLDETMKNKSKIIQNLEAELQNLTNCETNINNICLNEISSDLYESSLLESSSSSECLSDDAQDSNDSVNCSYRPSREYTSNHVNQRY